MRSSSVDNVIGAILVASFWMAVATILLAPIWVPIWLVNEMYQEWHPVVATVVAVPLIGGLLALYLWLYSRYFDWETNKTLNDNIEHYNRHANDFDWPTQVSDDDLG